MTRPRSRNEPVVFRWWPPVRDILAFAIGCGILWDQVVSTPSGEAQPELIGAGVVFILITGSGIAERYLDRYVTRDR